MIFFLNKFIIHIIRSANKEALNTIEYSLFCHNICKFIGKSKKYSYKASYSKKF